MNIGILGGSFDPIHNGHLALCKSALEKLPLHKILIIPSYNHPFKGVGSFFSFEERCLLIELALKEYFPGNDQVVINDIEKLTPGENYTYITLKKLHEQYGYSNFYFFLGADNLKAIHLWKNIDEIIKQTKLVCFNRKGYDIQKILKSIKLNNTQATIDAITENIFSVDLPDVSSTILREKLKSKQPLDGLTPLSVIKKIKEFDKH